MLLQSKKSLLLESTRELEKLNECKKVHNSFKKPKYSKKAFLLDYTEYLFC